jgi:hypothetical protein
VLLCVGSSENCCVVILYMTRLVCCTEDSLNIPAHVVEQIIGVSGQDHYNGVLGGVLALLLQE